MKERITTYLKWMDEQIANIITWIICVIFNR